MIEGVYIGSFIATLLVMVIFFGKNKNKISISLLASVCITTIFGSISSYILEPKITTVSKEFQEATLDGRGLKTKSGRKFYIPDSRVKIDTITGITKETVKIEFPELGGFWWTEKVSVSEFYMTDEVYKSYLQNRSKTLEKDERNSGI